MNYILAAVLLLLGEFQYAAPATISNGLRDYQSCLNHLKSGSVQYKSVPLPGVGWDNLRNKQMGQAAALSWENCALADNGMYLLPREVILEAAKESSVKDNSELMEHYNNYTSSDSHSINGAFSSEALYGLNGRLSYEYEQVKTIAIEYDLAIGRTQLRYHMYTARLQPDFQLSESLKGRLTDIVNANLSSKPRLVRYLSDLVVRDFGTHIVTSMDLGGVLEKVEFFKKSYASSSDAKKRAVSASMGVNFLQYLGITVSAGSNVANADFNDYLHSVKRTVVRAHGGPILGPNPNLNNWTGGLRENLVAMDRDGVPLYTAISRRSLPDIPATSLLQLRQAIKSAVMRYYQVNAVIGCQDPNSPSFDPIANLEGRCNGSSTTFNFAGVYQICHDSNPDAGFRLCEGFELKNPITGQFSCPANYEPVSIMSTTDRHWKICHNEACKESTSTLYAYWCVVKGGAKPSPSSGMAYGGAYVKDGELVNDITKSKSCSTFYQPYRIGRNLFLCLSLDLHDAARYQIPFAGFFSCESGNPLADPNRDAPVASATAAATSEFEVPKRCPDGFSQVTLEIINGCAVMQCVRGHSGLKKLPVRRPPFEDPEYELIESPVTQVDSHGWRWSYSVSNNTWKFLGFFGRQSASTGANTGSDKVKVSSEEQAPPNSKSVQQANSMSAVVLMGVLIVSLAPSVF